MRLLRRLHMPRYFFQVSGTVSHMDREGRELDDFQTAWSLAVSSTGELLRDIDGKLPNHAEIRTTVTDEEGVVLISLRFTGEKFPPRSDASQSSRLVT